MDALVLASGLLLMPSKLLAKIITTAARTFAMSSFNGILRLWS